MEDTNGNEMLSYNPLFDKQEAGLGMLKSLMQMDRRDSSRLPDNEMTTQQKEMSLSQEISDKFRKKNFRNE